MECKHTHPPAKKRCKQKIRGNEDIWCGRLFFSHSIRHIHIVTHRMCFFLYLCIVRPNMLQLTFFPLSPCVYFSTGHKNGWKYDEQTNPTDSNRIQNNNHSKNRCDRDGTTMRNHLLYLHSAKPWIPSTLYWFTAENKEMKWNGCK